MNTRTPLAVLPLALILLSAAPAAALQQSRPLAPVPATAQTVSPFFEGWYPNPDGTFTLSFGYFNRNRQEIKRLPIGEANRIEPAEFDGVQPEFFSTQRERGTFTVTVPADYAGGTKSVLWTLENGGETHWVRAKVGVPAYELSHLPMAMGSLPPVLRVEPQGPGGRTPRGVTASRALTASVGKPLTLTVWATDESQRADGAVADVALTWFTHQGPAPVEFEEVRALDAAAGGEAVTTATFREPGAYVLMVRASNFGARDSSPGDQCCWTNGYIPVHVSPGSAP